MKFKSWINALVLTGAALGVQTANAGVAMIWGETLSGMSLTRLNDFYNGLTGDSSTIGAGQLDTLDLSAVDLLWAIQPADAYTAAELATMADFLSDGGRIAFMGEHGSFAPSQNIRINAALTVLGANIQIVNTTVDGGFRSASVADGQIHAHTLTTGVDTYQYAAFAPLTVSGSAQVLMTGEDDTSAVMMAFQNIGPGSIFLITDQNVWDNSPTWGGGFSNARMFENLLTGVTGAPPVNGVPEPESLALVGVALLALTAARRRKLA